MTANDPGHLNNLDRTQRETLKAYWLALASAIDADPTKVVSSDMGDELFFLFGHDNPDAVLLRWLRARKWQVPAAVQHMMETLKWRYEWGLRKLLANGERDLIPEECACGKLYCMGKDKMNRPVSYVHARQHIKGEFPFENTEKLLIFFMETANLFAENPVEEGTVIIDMDNVTFQNLDYQHIKFMINAMQNFYPECLGLGLVVNAPWTFNVVWNVIKRWLDPVVAGKIHFLKNSSELTEYITPANIPQRLEGTRKDYQYSPPTKEENARIEVIRQDKEGMKKRKQEHKDAAEQYLSLTLKWAATKTQNQSNEERLNREKATQRLGTAFNELRPYVSTPTHYHRIGEIQDPVFDIAYERITTKDDEVTHF